MKCWFIAGRFSFHLCTLAVFLFGAVSLCGCDSKAKQQESDGSAEHEEKESDELAEKDDAGKSDADSARVKPISRDEEIERSEQLADAGRPSDAAEILQKLLLLDPQDTEVVFRFAMAKAASGELIEAIDLLEGIPVEHPEAGLAALGQSADWCMASNQYSRAEAKYKRFLRRMPGATRAHRQLAYLLNRQGRRHEAAEHIKKLCVAGDVQESELHSLMSLADAVYDDPAASEQATAGERLYLPIGASGKARKLFTDQDYVAAAEMLGKEVVDSEVPPTVNAFYGRALIEAQDETAFLQWLGKVDARTERCAEYWAAVGAYLLENQRFDEAVRALGEALNQDCTDARSLRRIHQALKAVGKDDAAKACFEYYVVMREVTLASNKIGENSPPSLESFAEIVGGLRELKRPLEAVLWESVEAFYANRSREVLSEIAKRRGSVAKSPGRFPDGFVEGLGVELAAFPFPKWDKVDVDLGKERLAKVEEVLQPSFVNVAEAVGLDHTYFVDESIQGAQFAIYQSVGGGVAVIDFDRDGCQDLYFAQGSGPAPEYVGAKSNLLYRSVDGRLQDVTGISNALEHRYSTGITVGDWNQDGFPDIVVANIGANRLLVNNGDGTFSPSPTDPIDNRQWMSTSLAMGDVTGDAIPDIVELVYADDETLPKRPERADDGTIVMVGPHEFKPAEDRLLVNDGAGRAVVQGLGPSKERATGLGIVIADFDNQPGNEIFVGNDLYADHMYRTDDSGVLRDSATLLGCAFAANGARTATMGIATADFDNSGALDLHLTNFEKESATLYLNRGKTFQDRAIQFKLTEASFPVVGFGCQAIDYDNNGSMDIVVANGHVENTGVAEQPFEQPHQLFANLGNRFSLTQVDDPSGYFNGNHVGRAVAKLDFNRDGMQDYVVTHIESRSAMMLNRTQSKKHWLRVNLVGTKSERDAIGARAQVTTAANRKWTQWVTGGDGYLCRNESSLYFGVGDAEGNLELTVFWPSGKSQTLQNLDVDQSVLVIENDLEAFVEAFQQTDVAKVENGN